jgi:hypothetical protein
VRLVLDDGSEVRTTPVARATGHADVPLPTEQIWAKFADCAATAAVPVSAARRLFEQMQTVDRLPGAAAIATV